MYKVRIDFTDGTHTFIYVPSNALIGQAVADYCRDRGYQLSGWYIVSAPDDVGQDIDDTLAPFKA